GQVRALHSAADRVGAPKCRILRANRFPCAASDPLLVLGPAADDCFRSPLPACCPGAGTTTRGPISQDCRIIMSTQSVAPTVRVLVTGAAGFIGSHVADHCLQLGMAVVAVDDLSGGSRQNVPAGATWVQGDLRDEGFVRELWAQHGPFDFVYHLAAYAAEGLSHFIRAYNYATNLVASMHLVNQAVESRACKCFVFTSS